MDHVYFSARNEDSEGRTWVEVKMPVGGTMISFSEALVDWLIPWDANSVLPVGIVACVAPWQTSSSLQGMPINGHSTSWPDSTSESRPSPPLLSSEAHCLIPRQTLRYWHILS